MSLLENMAEDFVKVYKSVQSDAFGGSIPVYVEGEHFLANATKQSNTELRIAEKTQNIGNYLITIMDKTVKLEQNDIIKCVRDNKYLKIDVKNDIETPPPATFDFTQCYGYEIKPI